MSQESHKHDHQHHETHDEKERDHTAHHEMMARDFKRRFIIGAVVTVPILLLSPTIQQWFGFSIPGFAGDRFVLAGLASVVALYASWPFYTNAFQELKEKRLGMMVLVSLAVGIGYLYSLATTFFIEAPDFYWEISTLAVVLLLGHWMEMRAVVATGGALKELVKLIPPKANLIKNGDIKQVETENLNKDDLILVRPGEKVPIDGEVIEGESHVNEAMITGESKPVSKSESDEVIGGTLNQDGALKVQVTKTGEETALAQIIELVKEAQASKPPVQKLADRAAHYLTLTAIIVGALTFISWNFFLGATFVFALTLTITVIVITCPHALGLAIPTVTTISSTLAARNGILVKDMGALERVREVTHIVFDKTGTLTKGEFGLTDIIVDSRPNYAKASSGRQELGDRDLLLQMAGAVERHSEHVIGQAIVKRAKEEGLKFPDVENFKAFSGKGVRGRIKNRESRIKQMFVGNQRLLSDNGIDISVKSKKVAGRLESQGKTVVYVAGDDEVLGLIALADQIRPEAKEAVVRLRERNIQVLMLTGDNEQTAEYVAGELGIDAYMAEVLPEDKSDKIAELKQKDRAVMMVGDGVNDAPALARADVGVAIGAGTDVAAATAQVVLVKNNPQDIVKLITLSQETSAKMKQNLGWAVGYNIIAIPIAAGILAKWNIFLRPEWGALLMSASSVIVVANAFLLKRKKL